MVNTNTERENICMDFRSMKKPSAANKAVVIMSMRLCVQTQKPICIAKARK